MSPLLVVLLICLVAVYLYRFAKARPPNFPPGPIRVPVLGNYLQLLISNYRYPYIALHELSRKYKTKVLGVFYGSFPAVVVCDYEGIKEISTRPEMQGRFSSVITRSRALDQNLGIFFIDGPLWEEQRRFSLRYMRDYGFGRRCEKLEATMEEEMSDIIDVLNGNRKDEEVFKNGLANIPAVFYAGFLNLYLEVLLSERIPRAEDSRLRAVVRGGLQFQSSGDGSGGLLVQQPWIRHFFPRMSGFLNFKEGNDILLNFIRDEINKHKSNSSDDHVRSFIDIYNNELSKQKATETPTTFSDDQLLIMALDLLLPSATAQASSFALLLILVLHYPEVQKKVQQELDAVVGRGRLPTLSDRPSLPYTEATLRESMRRQTLAPLAVIHRVTKDTTFRGYNLPKDTMVIPCLGIMHMDEDAWGDPQAFRPERFLDDNGLLLKKDYSLPFGAGKRLCPGETFARQNMFVFFAALMQNFTLEMPEGKVPPPLDSFNPGIIETIDEFWAKVVPRV